MYFYINLTILSIFLLHAGHLPDSISIFLYIHCNPPNVQGCRDVQYHRIFLQHDIFYLYCHLKYIVIISSSLKYFFLIYLLFSFFACWTFFYQNNFCTNSNIVCSILHNLHIFVKKVDLKFSSWIFSVGKIVSITLKCNWLYFY